MNLQEATQKALLGNLTEDKPNDTYKELEEKMAKEVNYFMIDKYDIDLTDGYGPDEDISDFEDYVENCLDDFTSQYLIDYEDANNVELTWDYELNPSVPHGIKIHVFEV